VAEHDGAHLNHSYSEAKYEDCNSRPEQGKKLAKPNLNK
jgi:hypothetical protein